jgi:hypothetical protein
MRIQEEQERRKREAVTLERLPGALEEVYKVLKDCIGDYTSAFGAESADASLLPHKLKVTVREPVGGKWQSAAKVEIALVPDLPGFRVERGEYSLAIEVGLLPTGKLFYRDCEQDKYLTMEDLTRRILDRALFPKLRE